MSIFRSVIFASLLLAGSAFSYNRSEVIIYGVAGGVTFTIDSGTLTTLRAGTISVTNTTYLQAVSTSPTGLGAWINCANAKKVIFQFLLSSDTDTATPDDTGTFYIDSDIRASTALPATQQPWNTTIGGVQYQTANGYQYTVPDPPPSLRWRMSGALRYTGSVYYTIVY